MITSFITYNRSFIDKSLCGLAENVNKKRGPLVNFPTAKMKCLQTQDFVVFETKVY